MASKVLVIEDDPDCRDVISDFLALKGYEVTHANSGKEALEQLQGTEVQPNLILLDLSLPGMSGWEFRDRQVRDPKLVDIPVVIVSAARDALDSEYSTIEANGYLGKPLDFDQLGVLLERFCP